MPDDARHLEAVVREMAEAQTADQIMKHWASEVAWFDISAENLHGYDAVHAEFDRQFGKLVECGADFLELDCHVSGDVGFVRSVQRFWAQTKTGDRHDMTTRQTDCFLRRDGKWTLVHQHISLPQA
ncbi:DUF4440 domain-containing protein [Aureimonas flava]|uniref:DUF4440 domain-containing protein n=1 Tax=Aureimonas flava TaxID=2320271 RepID=A0A3A1WG92_9HYPH|nr:nuclear transport factor 2 family protein [Aureimonas flava]RIX97004.1 DUF4440 domain-containing protein [Aureimonas flava]